MPPRAKQNARRTRARAIAELEEFTQTLETTLDGLRAAHAAVSVGEQTPLSDEARFLQRLAEPELPPGATNAERAAARAGAAAGVEHAANELGGHWAEAYQELHPVWQPTP